ncbi:MAG: twin-arginine translocase subunit TatC [Planctomycetota bacterium]
MTSEAPEEEAEDPFQGSRMTLGEHLDELRSRLLKGLAAVALAFAVAWVFRSPITLFVEEPYLHAMEMLEVHYVQEAQRAVAEGAPKGEYCIDPDPLSDDWRLMGFSKRPETIGAAEKFTVQLQICLYFALFVGSPVLFWQLWQFVAAGLYQRERRAIRAFFPLSMLLFVLGTSFGYLALVPYAVYFLNVGEIETGLPRVTLQAYLVFLRSLCLALGVVFQLPLLMAFLGYAGIVLPGTMARYRGHFAISAFVFAAILTPPDPITQSMLAIPMVFLYELGILAARVLARRARRAAVAT